MQIHTARRRRNQKKSPPPSPPRSCEKIWLGLFPVIPAEAGIQYFRSLKTFLDSGQFHWPALDADIELDALENPDQFPLVGG